MTIITAKIRKTDGQLVRVHPDGREDVLARRPIRDLTETEIEAAAADDPDARPMTEDELLTARRVPRAKTLRRALGLTQEAFAARYHIPLGTLRDWEQGRAVPDQPTRAYLKVIANDPEGVQQALESGPAECEGGESLGGVPGTPRVIASI